MRGQRKIYAHPHYPHLIIGYLKGDMMENQTYHSGFAAIIGRPNVGKSTLMNHLIGEKVAIVSPRPQTTRNRIMGILTKPGFQAVFLDTPGLHAPRNLLGETMIKAANEALEGADILLLMMDASDVRPCRPRHCRKIRKPGDEKDAGSQQN